MTDVSDRVFIVFQRLLHLPDGLPLVALTYNQFPGWDSVAHMSIIAALEDEFDCMLNTGDIIDMSSFEKAVEIMEKYIGYHRFIWESRHCDGVVPGYRLGRREKAGGARSIGRSKWIPRRWFVATRSGAVELRVARQGVSSSGRCFYRVGSASARQGGALPFPASRHHGQ
jgi:acyl carrier protein